MKKRLEFEYDILLEFDSPVRDHAFVLRCIPPNFPGQTVLDATLKLEPSAGWTLQSDSFGNLLQVGHIEQPHERFRYSIRGCVLVDLQARRPEAALPIYRYPSRYTRMSPEMTEKLAGTVVEKDEKLLAWQLCELVHGHMEYCPGVTGVATTAEEAYAVGKGVCQDYAHIYLAFARSCGLSARYVSGLPEGEGASHAWVEVLLDGIWTGIDPTRLCWCDAGYIRFNVGRDYSDCPMERGVFVGLANQRQTVYMKVGTQQ